MNRHIQAIVFLWAVLAVCVDAETYAGVTFTQGWVRSVDKASRGERLGLRKGDFIVSVRGHFFATDGALAAALRDIYDDTSLVVLRQGRACAPQQCSSGMDSVEWANSGVVLTSEVRHWKRHIVQVPFNITGAKRSKSNVAPLGMGIELRQDALDVEAGLQVNYGAYVQYWVEDARPDVGVPGLMRMTTALALGPALVYSRGKSVSTAYVYGEYLFDGQSKKMLKGADTVTSTHTTTIPALRIDLRSGFRWEKVMLEAILQHRFVGNGSTTEDADAAVSTQVPLGGWSPEPVQTEMGLGVLYAPMPERGGLGPLRLFTEVVYRPMGDFAPVLRTGVGFAY